MIKYFLPLLMVLPVVLNAQSAFVKHPFDIKIGVTTNKELEQRGTCVKQIEVRPDYFSCEVYNFSGNFRVHSSQAEVAVMIEYNAFYHNKLPKELRALGLNLQKGTSDDKGQFEFTDPGTSKDDVIAILKKYGIKNMEIISEKDILFEVDGHEVRFRIDKDGIFFVKITESY